MGRGGGEMRNIRASSEDRESGENRALYKVPLEMKGFIARACCSFFTSSLSLPPFFISQVERAKLGLAREEIVRAIFNEICRKSRKSGSLPPASESG